MVNTYSALNNTSSVMLLEAQQQSMMYAQQTALQPNAGIAAAVEEIQRQALQQAEAQAQQQVSNQIQPIGRINELGQVTGALVNESV